MTFKKEKLTKSNDKVISGVCGGIAEFLGWEHRKVRTSWLVATLLTGGTLIFVYIVFALIFPQPPKPFDINEHRVQ